MVTLIIVVNKSTQKLNMGDAHMNIEAVNCIILSLSAAHAQHTAPNAAFKGQVPLSASARLTKTKKGFVCVLGTPSEPDGDSKSDM
jgi:hypothetical protein